MAPRSNRATSTNTDNANEVEGQDQVQRIISALDRFGENMRNVRAPPTAQQQQPPLSIDQAAERFARFHPDKFSGAPNARKAELWLESMENLFSILHYPEERMIELATFQFEGAARNWWRTVDTKWRANEVERTWENFEK